MAGENLQEIALLIDNLRTSLGALRQLRRIAIALGETRTREELIPFITEPQEDNDDHLHLLAQVLGDLLEQVGGTQFASTLLTPLEALTGSDENSVRDAAVDSIRHIMTHMSKPHILQQILPLLSRLAKGSYPQRVAACELCAHVHQYISSQEGASARIEFEALTKDPLPVVRRAAAANVANLAEKAGPDHTDGLVRIFVQMAQDGHESIRRALVEHAPKLAACCISRPDAAKELLQHIIALMHDRSWRVRYCAATHAHELSRTYGPDVTRTELFPHYMGLLSDTDADVRGPACVALPEVCRHLEAPVLAQQLRPRLIDLAQDSSDLVRELLAEHIVELAPVLGRQQTIDLLLDPLLVLLRDKTPEVRLNVLRSLHSLSDIITLEQISEALLPTIDDLASEGAWRVRHELVTLAPQLAKHFGVEFFQREMVERVLAWLVDRTAIIRTAAAASICEVSKAFGPAWTKEHVLQKVRNILHNPSGTRGQFMTLVSLLKVILQTKTCLQVSSMATHSSYLCRISVLYCLRDLSSAIAGADVAATILPACTKAAVDPVPNTRFVAARVLKDLKPVVQPQQVEEVVLPCLKALLQDTDADVRFFAEQSLVDYEPGHDGS